MVGTGQGFTRSATRTELFQLLGEIVNVYPERLESTDQSDRLPSLTSFDHHGDWLQRSFPATPLVLTSHPTKRGSGRESMT